MIKRIISIALILVIVVSLSVVAVSAQETEKIYFEVPESWTNYSRVFCHIWEYDCDILSAWQSKKQICTQVKDNLYEYDTAKVGGLKKGVYYGVIFSVDIGLQTFDLVMSAECLGLTAYCTDEIYVSPQDIAKTALPAFWRGVDPSQYGPVLHVTTYGDVQGTCVAPGKTAVAVLTDFIDLNLEYACNYRDESPAEAIYRIGTELGLDEMEIAQAVYDSMVYVAWDYPENFIPVEPATKDEVPPEIIVDNTVVTFPEEENVETFTYYVFLKTPDIIENVQAVVSYDDDALELVSYSVPNLINAVVNAKDKGKIYFNASDVMTGMDFTEDAVLISAKFKIIDGGKADIGITIEEMYEYYGDAYYKDSKKLSDEVRIIEGVSSTGVPSAPTADATGTTDFDNTPSDVVNTADRSLYLGLIIVLAGVFAVSLLRKKYVNYL